MGAGSTPWPVPAGPARPRRRPPRSAKVGGPPRALPRPGISSTRGALRPEEAAGRAGGAAGLRLRRAQGGKASARRGGLERRPGDWGRSGRTSCTLAAAGARAHGPCGHPVASSSSPARSSRAGVGGKRRGPAGSQRPAKRPTSAPPLQGSPCSTGLSCLR